MARYNGTITIDQGKSGNQAVFRNIDTLSRLLDIQAEKFRPLLNGDRYMTDSELAGKLKLTRRTLADYRLNGKYPITR